MASIRGLIRFGRKSYQSPSIAGLQSIMNRCAVHDNESSFGIRASEKPGRCLPSKIADVT